MRIVEIRERTIPISRYNDSRLPSSGLTTSLVAIATDAVRAGKRVVGYGFSSVGRFGQSGLIRERFAPRLLAAQPQALTIPDRDGLDPFACWSVMMSGEKLGGHGETMRRRWHPRHGDMGRRCQTGEYAPRTIHHRATGGKA